VERESLAAAKREEEDDRSLPPLMAAVALDVDGEDRSSCLSRASLIRFRSAEVTSDLDPTPRSLYITNAGAVFLSAIRFDSVRLDCHLIITTSLKRRRCGSCCRKLGFWGWVSGRRMQFSIYRREQWFPISVRFYSFQIIFFSTFSAFLSAKIFSFFEVFCFYLPHKT